MKVEINLRMLTAGNRSLYLEYYETGFRKRENLHLYLVPDDAPNARMLNEQTYRKAQEIQAQRILTPPSFEKKQKTEENEAAKTMTWLQWCGDYVRCAMLDGNCQKMIQHKDIVRRRIEAYLKRAKKTDVLLKDVDKEPVSGLFGYMRNYRKQIKANGGRLAAYTLMLFEETVKAIFNKAVRDGLMAYNPVQELTREERFHAPDKHREYLTADELKHFLAVEPQTYMEEVVQRAFGFQPIFPWAALLRFLLSFLHRVSSLDLLQIKFGPSLRVDIRQVLWPLLTSRSSLLLLAFARLRDLSSYGHTLSILCLPDLPWAISDSYRTSISFAILSSPLGLISDFCPSDQMFAAGFLQIPSRGGHPCLWL